MHFQFHTCLIPINHTKLTTEHDYGCLYEKQGKMENGAWETEKYELKLKWISLNNQHVIITEFMHKSILTTFQKQKTLLFSEQRIVKDCFIIS